MTRGQFLAPFVEAQAEREWNTEHGTGRRIAHKMWPKMLAVAAKVKSIFFTCFCHFFYSVLFFFF